VTWLLLGTIGYLFVAGATDEVFFGDDGPPGASRIALAALWPLTLVGAIVAAGPLELGALSVRWTRARLQRPPRARALAPREFARRLLAQKDPR